MLEVKHSNIKNAGKGLFTTDFIKKGNPIAEFIGKTLTPDQINDLSDDAKYYLIDLDGYYTLYSQYCPAAYANDAEGFTKTKFKNNSEIQIFDDYTVYLVATRNIQPGEEIFTGYGKEYWDIFKYNQEIDEEDSITENIIIRFGDFLSP